jgi:translation initiation factor 3 subunit G
MTEIINNEEIKFPSVTESEPDKDGIITIIEYKINENNQKIKIIKKIRRHMYQVKIYQSAIERQKNWVKFGKALENTKNTTYISPEEIFMEVPNDKDEEENVKEENQKKVIEKMKIQDKKCVYLKKEGIDIIESTLKIPVKERSETEKELIKEYERLTKQKFKFEILVEEEKTNEVEPVVSKTADKSKPILCKTCGGPHWTRTCPQTMKEEEKNDIPEESEENILSRTVIVSNLNKETTEENIFQLFCSIGQINRLYIAKDYETHVSKCYGFVTFLHKTDAEKAIERLNNRGFEHLILGVAWAKGKNSK